MMNPVIIYDIETFINVFTASFYIEAVDEYIVFEISEHKDQALNLVNFISRNKTTYFVGFNNVHFDYPVLHYIINNYKGITAFNIYQFSQLIIRSNSKEYDVAPWHYLCPQIDLFLIHHFDNKNRGTSLKQLEFALKMHDIKELPCSPHKPLNRSGIDKLIAYNIHDVKATYLFYKESKSKIEYRLSLGEKYLNLSDASIGKKYIKSRLKVTSGQSPRKLIKVKDIIFDYVGFSDSKFSKILDEFKKVNIAEGMGKYSIPTVIDGVKFKFGKGGLHASIYNTLVLSDENNTILDIDVVSYYPTLAIKNRLYPEHLGLQFLEFYESIFEERQTYEKGTSENKMLKEALNAVYGDSNQKFSFMYDPRYTFTTTINGQLLLLMLVEKLLNIKTVKIIQANTDGITIKYNNNVDSEVKQAVKLWELLTKLKMEFKKYKWMALRDVSNYIAVDLKGNIKRKGAYDYNKEWHSDHSELVIPRAIDYYLSGQGSFENFIYNCVDAHAFTLCKKTRRKDDLLIGNALQSRVTRYYIAKNGEPMVIKRPPTGKIDTWKRKNGLTDEYYNSQLNLTNTSDLIDIDGKCWNPNIHTANKSKYKICESRQHVGYLVKECNSMDDFDFKNLNYDYYIDKTKKLIDSLFLGVL